MDAQILVMLTVIAGTITVISILGILPALLSYFLDFCFWRYNIFAFWLPFISQLVIKKLKPVKYKHFMLEHDIIKRQELFFDECSHQPLYKLLGGCAICLNFWLCLATYPLFVVFVGVEWYFIPVYILASHFFLRKIMKVD